jgi:hypothetical protein
MATIVLQPLGLSLAVNPGETFRAVLDRFNAYRSPYRQITQITTPAGASIPLDTPIHGYTVVRVVETEIPSPATYRPAAASSS